MTYIPSLSNIIDAQNTSSTPLLSSSIFIGSYTNIENYSMINIICNTDTNCNLEVQFSNDQISIVNTIKFSIFSNVNKVNQTITMGKYYRLVLTNTSLNNQTTLNLQSILSNDSSIISGRKDNGSSGMLSVSNEGYVNTAIRNPMLPFGALHTENLSPVFQLDPVYGINSLSIDSSNIVNSGTITASYNANTFDCKVISSNSSATLQSVKRVKYRPGQGVVYRFTGLYDTPQDGSEQWVGASNLEDGMYFGYSGTNFGILYENRGQREIRTLTISGGITAGASYNIALNGSVYTNAISIPAGITSNNAMASIIGRTSITGWSQDIKDNTVIFISDNVGTSGNYNGSYYFNNVANPNGAFTRTRIANETNKTFIKQSDWNVDRLDGYGSSSCTANWQKGNVFEVGMQYLGFGCLTFKVETTNDLTSEGFSTCHTIKLPNTLSASSFKVPSFPFAMRAINNSNTTDITVKTASMAAFTEGLNSFNNTNSSYIAELTSGNLLGNPITSIFTVMNKVVYNNTANQCVIHLTSIFASYSTTNRSEGGIIYLIKNGTLGGSTHFQDYSPNSCASWDKSNLVSVSYSNNSQVLWTGHITDAGGQVSYTFRKDLEEYLIQPGEWLTVGFRIIGGSSTYDTLSISLNTREDQ